MISMNEIIIKIERITDNDMSMNYYKMEANQLMNINPLDELKTIETLIKALRIFEETKLYDMIKRGIMLRLARLLAYYNLIGENNANTTTNQ